MRSVAAGGMMVLVLAGCCGRDERLAAVALEASRQQAEQNLRMAQSQREVAAGARQLVEADARARQEMAELHRGVAGQQSEVGRQRDRLDDERRALGAERRRESLLGPVIGSAATVLACLLPLVICVLVLWPRPDHPEAAELTALLVEDLAASRPRLLGRSAGSDRPDPEYRSVNLPGPDSGRSEEPPPDDLPLPESPG